MNAENSKEVKEIADYIFANTKVNRKNIVAHFGALWHNISDRTIIREYGKAKEYNQTRLQKQEKIRDELLATETANALKSCILSRNDILVYLSNLVRDAKFDSDKIRAAVQLSAMQGWNAPTEIKNEFTYQPLFNIKSVIYDGNYSTKEDIEVD
jgi:hypothetical protein